jgi:hypothetical protein
MEMEDPFCTQLLDIYWDALQQQRQQRVQSKCDQIALSLLYVAMVENPATSAMIARNLDGHPVFSTCKQYGWTWDGFNARNPGTTPNTPAARPPLPLPKPLQQPRQTVTSPPAQRPWSGTASGTCEVVYEGYLAGGQHVNPAPATEFKHSMDFRWDEEHRVYVITSGSQTIVGPGPSFSFNDKCAQNQANYQPGCIYKSRSNFTVSGTITTSGDTITYVTHSVEDMNLGNKIADGNCTLRKDNP